MKERIMGSEVSSCGKFDVEGEAIEVTDNWTLHRAASTSSLASGCSEGWSAFVSAEGSGQGPLETLTKNLMVYRHPSIVKYVSSWTKNSTFYLITEEVSPLAQALPAQSTLQICIGLHSILSALTFLHEVAVASHNNLCCSSVYITREGVWKLGGLNFLKKISEMTPNYLKENRSKRFKRGVAPEEDLSGMVNPIAVDQYALGVFVEELLRKRSDDNLPGLLEFKELCKTKLQSSDPGQRVAFSQVLKHSFFHHDFIRIHKFLEELPLKCDADKQRFFRDLTEQLTSLPECVVASQLTSLLLSRIVLLDLTAQQHLLPIVLTPKKGADFQSDALFSEGTFKAFIVPRLLQMLCVRDASVRLFLLQHFHLFYHMFDKEQLQHHVLPELLVGIKDVSDEMVSWTLRALSDLVPLLGAAVVIGGKRGRWFADGRPSAHVPVTKVPVDKRLLPERLSPDGGEDNSSSLPTVEADLEIDDAETLDDTEAWSDWDVPSEKKQEEEAVCATETEVTKPVLSVTLVKKTPLPDIDSLDIKNPRQENSTRLGRLETDFFQDMEPVISKASILSLDSQPTKSKFDVVSDDPVGGWDEDTPDWSIS